MSRLPDHRPWVSPWPWLSLALALALCVGGFLTTGHLSFYLSQFGGAGLGCMALFAWYARGNWGRDA